MLVKATAPGASGGGPVRWRSTRSPARPAAGGRPRRTQLGGSGRRGGQAWPGPALVAVHIEPGGGDGGAMRALPPRHAPQACQALGAATACGWPGADRHQDATSGKPGRASGAYDSLATVCVMHAGLLASDWCFGSGLRSESFSEPYRGQHRGRLVATVRHAVSAARIASAPVPRPVGGLDQLLVGAGVAACRCE